MAPRTLVFVLAGRKYYSSNLLVEGYQLEVQDTLISDPRHMSLYIDGKLVAFLHRVLYLREVKGEFHICLVPCKLNQCYCRKLSPAILKLITPQQRLAV